MIALSSERVRRRAWRLAGIGLLAAGGGFAGGLNDTGQTTCSNDTSEVSPEPSTHPRQDCSMGRDAAAAAGLLPKIGAGSKGFDYTKIANNGRVLPATASLGPGADQWACTRDNLTGLNWEMKTTDGGLHHWTWSYTWYDDIHTDNNGGDAGAKGGNTCGGTLPKNECNTQAYAAAVNAAGLCGWRDWRLPTRVELYGLVDHGIDPGEPNTDSIYFPNQNRNFYWSSSSDAFIPTSAQTVRFENGDLGGVVSILKGMSAHVRLVRGGQ